MYTQDPYVFISEIAENVLVVTRIANKSALEKRYVEDGRVEIDELEDENFKGQVVVEFGLRAMHFWTNKSG